VKSNDRLAMLTTRLASAASRLCGSNAQLLKSTSKSLLQQRAACSSLLSSQLAIKNESALSLSTYKLQYAVAAFSTSVKPVSSSDALDLPSNFKLDPKSSFYKKLAAISNDTNNNTDSDSDTEDNTPSTITTSTDIYTSTLPLSTVGSIHLDASIWLKSPIRLDLLQAAVHYYRSCLRGRRKAKTKTIGEVSGSGKKRRQQKGLGRARMGHSRPPHHRKGAKAHGPKNTRDYGDIKLNKKVRKLALRHALSQKYQEGSLVLVNDFDQISYKTKEFDKWIKEVVDEKQSALVLDHDDEDKHRVTANLRAAGANIPHVKVANHLGANVYDIIKYNRLILSLAALEKIESRLKEE
jgi:large subunit ribosomal protein L4